MSIFAGAAAGLFGVLWHGIVSSAWLRAIADRAVEHREETLAQMRSADPPVYYLVGTPKGRLSKLEKALLAQPWQAVREGVEVKLLPQDQELYVLAQSRARIHKERAMRRRKLEWLWARLQQISAMSLTREELLMKLGAARAKARAAWRLLDIDVAADAARFSYALNRAKLRQVRRREGRYLLRTNLCGRDPAQLWQFYIQLVEVEAACKNLKAKAPDEPAQSQPAFAAAATPDRPARRGSQGARSPLHPRPRSPARHPPVTPHSDALATLTQ